MTADRKLAVFAHAWAEYEKSGFFRKLILHNKLNRLVQTIDKDLRFSCHADRPPSLMVTEDSHMWARIRLNVLPFWYSKEQEKWLIYHANTSPIIK